MRNALGRLTGVALAALLAACAGVPVSVGSRADGPIPKGTERTISAEACGFQLFSFIPINVNQRADTAYKELEEAAAGDFITDVQVQEHWKYAFVGTVYCTVFQAKAIHPSPS